MTTERRIKTAANLAVTRRNYRRARDRALARLSNTYPETYKELLEQEKVNDEQLGKKWFDIDGSTSASMVVGSGSDTPGRQASEYHKEDEGDEGGEA